MNYIHIVINNGMHQSVGVQPTVGFDINLQKIAEGCGYKFTTTITNKDEFDSIINDIDNKEGPIFIEIRVVISTNERV